MYVTSVKVCNTYVCSCIQISGQDSLLISYILCGYSQKELHKKQAKQVVSHLLFALVNGIRTPERPSSPIDAYITEEEIFARNNPGVNID